MIKDAIKKVVDKQDLSYDEAYTVMNEIMSGKTSAVENAAYLAALSTRFQVLPQQCVRMLRLSFMIWTSSTSLVQAATIRGASMFQQLPHSLQQLPV